MRADELIRSLEQYGVKSLRRPVLFLGEEEYWVQAGIAALKRLLFTAEDEEYNCLDQELKSVEPVNLTEWLSNPPFFSTNRLVILRGVEEVKANLESVFLRLLAHPANGVYVVLTARQLDRRKKFTKELTALVELCECPVLKVYEARKWVQQEAQKLKLRLSTDQINQLLEVKGVSLGNLYNELVKLRTFLGGEQRVVTREEWTSLLGEASAINVFALTDGIFEGQTERALKQLILMLEAGEPPLKILGMLGGEVRRLLMAWDLVQRGRGGSLQTELGCHSFVAEKLSQRVKTVDYQQLRQAHRRILEADARLKTGGEARLELEMALLDLCTVFSPGRRGIKQNHPRGG